MLYWYINFFDTHKQYFFHLFITASKHDLKILKILNILIEKLKKKKLIIEMLVYESIDAYIWTPIPLSFKLLDNFPILLYYSFHICWEGINWYNIANSLFEINNIVVPEPIFFYRFPCLLLMLLLLLLMVIKHS